MNAQRAAAIAEAGSTAFIEPRAVSLNIQRNILEPQRPQRRRHRIQHLQRKRRPHLHARNLNSRQLAVMPHPHLPKPKLMQRGLRGLHLPQRLGCHRPPIFDPRREARRRRLVGQRERPASRASCTNLRLPQPRRHQRRQRMVQRRRPLPRPEVAFIIEVPPIRNLRKAPRRAQLHHARKQLILAVEAAARIVSLVLRVQQLLRGQHLHRNAIGAHRRKLTSAAASSALPAAKLNPQSPRACASPSVRFAALARNAESVPPEYATSSEPAETSVCSRRDCFAARSEAVPPTSFGIADILPRRHLLF